MSQEGDKAERATSKVCQSQTGNSHIPSGCPGKYGEHRVTQEGLVTQGGKATGAAAHYRGVCFCLVSVSNH